MLVLQDGTKIYQDLKSPKVRADKAEKVSDQIVIQVIHGDKQETYSKSMH